MNEIDVDKVLREQADKIESGLITIRTKQEEIFEFVKTVDQKVLTMDEYMKAQFTIRRAGISQSASDFMSADADATNLLPKADPKQRFSFCKAIIAAMSPSEADGNGCGYELDVMRETKKVVRQALSADIGSTGGFLVPIQQLPEMIEQLKAKTVIEQAGATILPDLTGSPVHISRKTGNATASWITAGQTLTNTQQTFDQVSLSVKRLASFTQIDNLTLRLANPALDAVVERDLSSELALARDLAGIRGDGTAGQPVGVRFAPGVSLQTISGTQVPTVDDLQALVQTLDEANAPNLKRAWIMTPRTRRTLQAIVDASARPILTSQIDPSPGQLNTILGNPMFVTTQIPNNLGGGTDESELYYGDWSEVLIGNWGAMEILASNVAGNALANDQTFVRAIMYTDIAVRHGASFAVYTDVQLT